MEMDIKAIFETVRDKALDDSEFRDRLLADAREAIFQATGEVIPDGIRVTVHESSNKEMYFVLPLKPAASQPVELSDDEMDQVAGGGKEDVIYTKEVQYGHIDDKGNIVIDRTEKYDTYTQI